jgi:hypothetical protein
MPSSRRKFLKAGMLAALFSAVPLKSVLSQSWKDRDGNPNDGSAPGLQNNDPLAAYTKAAFVSYLNSIFQLRTGFSVIAVTLLKVDDLTAPKGGECFSLLFRGGGGPALPQDTYTVDHPALGTFKLFLVPVGTDDNGAQGYLATINRLSYADALIPAPKPATSRSGSASTSPATSPTNASPATTQPAQTSTPATIPRTSNPAEKPKPVRKKKPSWKSNDNDDFEIN